MTTYAIGDIQGCFAEFQALLEKINYTPKLDTLWFTGDLVNRGKQSLEVLHYIKNLSGKTVVVLGNHDLHLIALAYQTRAAHPNDTLEAILNAPDRIELIEWLRHQQLLHYDIPTNSILSHAGLSPLWDLAEGQRCAEEVITALSAADPTQFLKNMYGNEPSKWSTALTGFDRLRCIVNYLTRMRYCHADGSLDLRHKGTIENMPKHLYPWFHVPNRIPVTTNIIFGHWAALGGKTDANGIYPLDTGCVWGNCLTALNVENKERTTVDCKENKKSK